MSKRKAKVKATVLVDSEIPVFRTDYTFDEMVELREQIKDCLPMISAMFEGNADRVQRVSDLFIHIERIYNEAKNLLTETDKN